MIQKYISMALEIIIFQKRKLMARESKITVQSHSQLLTTLPLELSLLTGTLSCLVSLASVQP